MAGAGGSPSRSTLGLVRFARYRVLLEAVDRLDLPVYKGSTFRGAFGGAFKRIACAQRERLTCLGCLFHETCPYGYVFETPAPPGGERLRKYESVPRPFVLEPPAEERTRYAPGSVLDLGLVLMGRAITLFPYFVVALRAMGEAGVGRGRGRARLVRIESDPPAGLGEARTVYDGAEGTVRAHDAAITGDQVIRRVAAAGLRVEVRFETPTRLKFEGRLHGKPEFHVLVRNLLRRLSSLAYFHHGFELDLDFRGLIDRAAGVRLAADRTGWVDWERYSSRQDERMKLGGLVGEAVYEAPAGLWADFLPLLALGELSHIGKNVTFGLGKIRWRAVG